MFLVPGRPDDTGAKALSQLLTGLHNDPSAARRRAHTSHRSERVSQPGVAASPATTPPINAPATTNTPAEKQRLSGRENRPGKKMTTNRLGNSIRRAELASGSSNRRVPESSRWSKRSADHRKRGREICTPDEPELLAPLRGARDVSDPTEVLRFTTTPATFEHPFAVQSFSRTLPVVFEPPSTIFQPAGRGKRAKSVSGHRVAFHHSAPGANQIQTDLGLP